MDWADTEEQAAFRAEVRAFIADRMPERYRSSSGVLVGNAAEELAGGWQADRQSDDPARSAVAAEWSNALAERGWVAPHWPTEYGGAGLTVSEQFIYNQEMAEANAPQVGGMGVSLLGPTLIVHGNEEQKQEHLTKILSGEVAWAQGYSEPGAGSDLAALQTRADRDGDDYVLNGQKIWTSGAHYSDWLFALVRTDPDAPKHRGISFLMMDIKTPGITIRPLTDMGWNQPFCETFFEDVRVPAANLIGDENRGWYVGMTLLDFERSGIGGAIGDRRTVAELTEFMASDAGRGFVRAGWEGPTRLEIADRAVEIEVLYNFALRIVSMQNAGLIPNYEASVNKLFGSELSQALAHTGMKAFGLYGNIWGRDERAPLNAYFTHAYISAVPVTIFSGSSEIQRNVIATRGLGLPRG